MLRPRPDWINVQRCTCGRITVVLFAQETDQPTQSPHPSSQSPISVHTFIVQIRARETVQFARRYEQLAQLTQSAHIRLYKPIFPWQNFLPLRSPNILLHIVDEKFIIIAVP